MRLGESGYRHQMEAAYQAGLDSEGEVLEWLVDAGCSTLLTPSAIDQNQDIDCYTQFTQSTPVVPCSIKTQNKAAETGNICLELFVKKPTGWSPSWWLTGKADVYLIRVDDELWYAEKGLIAWYITRYGFSGLPLLSKNARLTQEHHYHTNAKVGLLPMKKLVESGVLYYIGNINDPRGYVPPVYKHNISTFLPKD